VTSVGWEKTQFEMDSSTSKTKDEEENSLLQSSARGRQPTSAPNNQLTRYKITKTENMEPTLYISMHTLSDML
jgi:hypothetical protein